MQTNNTPSTTNTSTESSENSSNLRKKYLLFSAVVLGIIIVGSISAGVTYLIVTNNQDSRRPIQSDNITRTPITFLNPEDSEDTVTPSQGDLISEEEEISLPILDNLIPTQNEPVEETPAENVKQNGILLSTPITGSLLQSDIPFNVIGSTDSQTQILSIKLLDQGNSVLSEKVYDVYQNSEPDATSPYSFSVQLSYTSSSFSSGYIKVFEVFPGAGTFSETELYSLPVKLGSD